MANSLLAVLTNLAHSAAVFHCDHGLPKPLHTEENCSCQKPRLLGAAEAYKSLGSKPLLYWSSRTSVLGPESNTTPNYLAALDEKSWPQKKLFMF